VSDILRAFEGQCATWYEQERTSHNWRARQEAYMALIQRHGQAAVWRHQPAIRQVLTNVELRYATGAAAARLTGE